MTEAIRRLSAALADRYTIERELGHGGMATVYLAHDLKHDRQVAIKVLRPELAAVIGAERFLSEIKTTANLQHPHILPLHDSGDANGFLFYVMPLIEGETLRAQMDREKQLPVADAVRLATEVAAALDYAHRHGVIHRDIKPENILLHDGSALVADFGIALAASAAGGSRMTETGMSLGTPHYMSPEQAMGEREITARSDVYALGCVLYEMLTGDPPFTGSTAQAIVARVMTESPRGLVHQRHTIPGHIEAAVLTALEKLPADRFATAAEFAAALADTHFVSTTTTTRATATPGRRWHPMASAGWAVAAIGGVAAYLGWSRADAEIPVTRFIVSLAPDQGLQPGRGTRISFSPDGSVLAYIGPGESGSQVWVRRRDELTARPLLGTERAQNVFFAPDGTQVGFVTDAQHVMVASLAGGPPTTVADSGVGLDGGTWGDDGYIYYDGLTGSGTAGLARVPASLGGRAEVVSRVDTAAGESDHIWPSALPDGRGVLFTISRAGNLRNADVAVLDLKSGTHRVLARGVGAIYASSGHVIYVTVDGSLMAVPFDLGSLTVTGTAVALAGGIGVRPFGATDLALSRDGSLAYLLGGKQSDPAEIVSVTLGGVAEPVDPGWVGDFRTVALAPNGQRLAVSLTAAGEEQVWIKTLPRGPLTKFTSEGFLNYRPSWTPDGINVGYVSNQGARSDLMVKRADGGGQAKVELHLDRLIQEAAWSPRGDWLVYRLSPRDIFAVSTAGDTVPIADTPAEERAPAVSPDGRWVAYESDVSGRFEVHVRPFPDAQVAQYVVSTSGGRVPRWAPDGRSLYFMSATAMMAVDIIPGAAFTMGERRALFPIVDYRIEEGSYAVTPNGRHFLMIRNRAAGERADLVIVTNFLQELRAKVPQ